MFSAMIAVLITKTGAAALRNQDVDHPATHVAGFNRSDPGHGKSASDAKQIVAGLHQQIEARSARIVTGASPDSIRLAKRIEQAEPQTLLPEVPTFRHAQGLSTPKSRATFILTPRRPGAAMLDEEASTWVSGPTAEEVLLAYPKTALRDGAPGSAVLSCLERVNGMVTGCRVLSETPAHAGFGQAAVHLSARFHFRPILRDGSATEGEVRIPYNFSVSD